MLLSGLAVITGASSGIGRATAIELATRGFNLLLTGRNADRLSEVAKECSARGNKVDIFVGDLTDLKACAELSEKAKALAVNQEVFVILSHGVADFGDVGDMSAELAEKQIRVNLIAPIYLLTSIVPWMLNCGGRIINVLSIASEEVLPGSSAYAASKAGLRHFGKVLNAEVRRKGILVTNLLPGAVDTPMWDFGPGPDRADMLSPQAVAKVIAGILATPNVAIDELILMPPKGVL